MMKRTAFHFRMLAVAFLLISVPASGAEKGAPGPKRVLFLGDSLSAGYGLDPADSFPALIQQKIREKGWDFEVINAGLSGETTAGGLRRIDWMLRRKIDVLVLELGANDGLRGISLAVTKRNLQGIVNKAKARYPGIRVVIAGMMVPPNLGPDYTAEFQAIFPRLAEDNKATLIPFLLEGVAGRPELNLADGIHPTARGHEVVADTVWKHLEDVLAELD